MLSNSIRLILISITLVLAPTMVRAEVPNRPVEAMRESAGTIVTGSVASIHVSKIGRSETRIYTIRVHSVQKGDAKPEDRVLVSTWHTTQLPGATGSNGHRGTPALGETITVYAGSQRSAADSRSAVQSVILPNGFQPAAPIFATPELLNSSPSVQLLDETAAKAADAEAWRECETIVRAAMKLEAKPERSMLLLRSLAAQNKLTETVREGELALAGITDVRSKSFQGIWFATYQSAFDLGDTPAMIRVLQSRAKAEGTPNAWMEVADALERLPDDPAVKAAIADAKKKSRP
ncbi:MAG: hypothetical protein K2W85_03230 [Phycisphaerales bacterium]|nr:hypothetical protein [Phycisphaerales bacterium]